MKGVIFQAVEEGITNLFSAETWDDLLDTAQLDGVYTSLGTYPDDHLHRLVAAAESTTGLSRAEVLRAVGRSSFPGLARRNAGLIEGHDFWSFVAQLDQVIHPEVMKLYPGATVPAFDTLETGDGLLVLRYRSERGLWDLACGLLEGAAEVFGTLVEVELVLDGEHSAVITVTQRDSSGGG